MRGGASDWTNLELTWRWCNQKSKSDDVKVDAARLHGLTSVSDLLVFSPGDHQNRRAAAPIKSRQLSLDQKLGAAPATISGDVAWVRSLPSRTHTHTHTHVLLDTPNKQPTYTLRFNRT